MHREADPVFQNAAQGWPPCSLGCPRSDSVPLPLSEHSTSPSAPRLSARIPRRLRCLRRRLS
eukprot:1337149-Prymnesium_polylepis.1